MGGLTSGKGQARQPQCQLILLCGHAGGKKRCRTPSTFRRKYLSPYLRLFVTHSWPTCAHPNTDRQSEFPHHELGLHVTHPLPLRRLSLCVGHLSARLRLSVLARFSTPFVPPPALPPRRFLSRAHNQPGCPRRKRPGSSRTFHNGARRLATRKRGESGLTPLSRSSPRRSK